MKTNLLKTWNGILAHSLTITGSPTPAKLSPLKDKMQRPTDI